MEKLTSKKAIQAISNSKHYNQTTIIVMENLQSIFESLFKFKANESLRHRGDNKDHSDMGLLVLHREIIEDVNDDGLHTYERHYLCRMIRFSGSGEVQRFREKELMSIQEYNQKKIEDETERNAMRLEISRTEAEVFKAFGVNRKETIKLKADPENEYTVTGFKTNAETGKYELLIRQSGGIESGRKRDFIQSPDEILRTEDKK